MGNNTKVTHVAVGGAVATVLAGVLRFYQPELLAAIPGAEAAFAVIVTAGIAFAVKAD